MSGRRVDRLGLSLFIASAGDSYRDQQALAGESSTRHETITELTYLVPLTSWLSMQPDVQFIRNAGLSRDSADSWAFGIRFTLGSGWQF